MGSLTTHLTEPELHGRLPFHPECPICQQTRVVGTLQTGGLLPARVPASLAAGLLAASLVVPGPALAAEQEQEHEGTAAPSQSATTDSANDPDFDPGGNPTELPSAPPETPQPPPAAQPQPSAPAPAGQPAPAASASGEEDDPVVDNGDGTDPNAAPAQPNPTTPAPTTPAPTPPPSSSTPPSAPAPASPPPEQPPAVVAPPAAQPPSTTKQTASSGHPRADARQHAHARQRQRVVHRQQPPVAAQPAAAPPATPVPATTRTVPVVSTTARTVPRARPGDCSHAVQPGESLRAIASDLLGRDAGAARIAHEVHRLWELNKDRIATGDPDLVMIGTRLLLR